MRKHHYQSNLNNALEDVVWVGLCAVLVLAAANLAILAAFPGAGTRAGTAQAGELDTAVRPGFEYPGSYESPVIVYDGANETWHLRNVTAYNRAINLGERYSLDPTRPEDIRYTPDIAIEGDKISLDFFIRNLAGEDCARADLAVATEITSLNATTGSDGDILPGIATTLPIDNLAAGEWREVRVTADLPRPGQEVLYMTVDLTAPYAFTTRTARRSPSTFA